MGRSRKNRATNRNREQAGQVPRMAGRAARGSATANEAAGTATVVTIDPDDVGGTGHDEDGIKTDPGLPRGFARYRGRIVTAENLYKEVEKARRRVSRQDPKPQTIADLFPVHKSERPKDGSPATVAKRAKSRKQARKSRRNNRK